MREAHLIYFSPTDTTKKVCTAIGEGTGFKLIHHDITLPEKRKGSLNFNDEQLVIVGAPVYSGRLPKIAADYFKKLHGHKTKIVIVCVYGNRKYEDALVELEDLSVSCGFTPVAAAAFIGEHAINSNVAKGRPDKEDVFKARELGKATATKLLKIDEKNWLPLKITGHRPYREVIRKNHDLVPVTTRNCNECGICAKHCPTGAIHKDRVEIVSSNLCIRCFSCVKRCPKDAKVFEQEVVLKVQKWLEDECRDVRKEPEMFI